MFLGHQAHLVSVGCRHIYNMTVYERRSREPPHLPGTVYIPLEVPFAVSP
jgi:hypothetical protein